jgi:hypothetical protein
MTSGGQLMRSSCLAGHEEQEARSIRIGALEPFDLRKRCPANFANGIQMF